MFLKNWIYVLLLLVTGTISTINGMNETPASTSISKTVQNLFEPLSDAYKNDMKKYYLDQIEKATEGPTLKNAFCFGLIGGLAGLIASVSLTTLITTIIIFVQLIIRYKKISCLCNAIEKKFSTNERLCHILSKIKDCEIYLYNSRFNVFLGKNSSSKIILEIIFITLIATIATTLITILFGTLFALAGSLYSKHKLSILKQQLIQREEQAFTDIEKAHTNFVNLYTSPNNMLCPKYGIVSFWLAGGNARGETPLLNIPENSSVKNCIVNVKDDIVKEQESSSPQLNTPEELAGKLWEKFQSTCAKEHVFVEDKDKTAHNLMELKPIKNISYTTIDSFCKKFIQEVGMHVYFLKLYGSMQDNGESVPKYLAFTSNEKRNQYWVAYKKGYDSKLKKGIETYKDKIEKERLNPDSIVVLVVDEEQKKEYSRN